ncbi:Pet127-domain-containing protein [Guyanagaster necrorhizus]|uniref:Pet127-domain-containing protein n=1 Tax=Guyanagaster necrorhizus TaxID=856835 RepID=A0A9P7VLX1_9AGAR|nr:Pet127-domain-containing protein [Guyanagaster necrorhizus MCA 3950]KAG7443094.1 Pet127-domain-containing protein [Guyanagaster necrorhizus MCA 3950]
MSRRKPLTQTKFFQMSLQSQEALSENAKTSIRVLETITRMAAMPSRTQETGLSEKEFVTGWGEDKLTPLVADKLRPSEGLSSEMLASYVSDVSIWSRPKSVKLHVENKKPQAKASKALTKATKAAAKGMTKGTKVKVKAPKTKAATKVKAKETKPNNAKAEKHDDTPVESEGVFADPNPLKLILPYAHTVEGMLYPTEGHVLQDVKPVARQRPVARLSHGLDRVLFNPGVHWLRDPRSHVYNFPPSVESIPRVFDFAFERLPGFTKSSRDEELWNLANRENRKFAGSTSSLSGMLCQIYFLISGNRPVNIETLSQNFQHAPTNFTPGQRMPPTVVFNHRDSTYAIDSHADTLSDKNILTWMGTLLEKYLTTPLPEFPTFMRTETPDFEAETTEENIRDAFRFSKSKTFVMRSQLDCQDPRLPGTGVFDIKTRACLPIRMDILNFKENSGYIIKQHYGVMESFEREYYDLTRAAFLKYSFQARIGNMDGVFVAYHNTERMFGFQYVSLAEMDSCLFGQIQGIGDRVFDKCVSLLEAISEEVVNCFPGQSVKATFETVASDLNVFVQPADWKSESPEDKSPIKQLVVRLKHYLGDPARKVSSSKAIEYSHVEDWTTQWTIGLTADEQEPETRAQFRAALTRKFRAHCLPEGVSFANIAEFWTNLNFNGQPPDPAEALSPEFFLENFTEPDAMILMLRQAAKNGRAETERLKDLDKSRPIYVLGERFDEAVAHGGPDADADIEATGEEGAKLMTEIRREPMNYEEFAAKSLSGVETPSRSSLSAEAVLEAVAPEENPLPAEVDDSPPVATGPVEETTHGTKYPATCGTVPETVPPHLPTSGDSQVDFFTSSSSPSGPQSLQVEPQSDEVTTGDETQK